MYLDNLETEKLISGLVHVLKYMQLAKIDLYHLACSDKSCVSWSVDGQSFLAKTKFVATGVGTGLQESIPARLSSVDVAFNWSNVMDNLTRSLVMVTPSKSLTGPSTWTLKCAFKSLMTLSAKDRCLRW